MRPADNLLLAGLPDRELDRLWPHLSRVRLRLRETLIAPDEPITAVYFPERGVLGQVVTLDDGAAVEVGMVGREGVAGLAVWLGATQSPDAVICQVPGSALRMSAPAFRDQLGACPVLRERLQRYTQAILSWRAQIVACDRLHPVQARLARWLLKTHDRVDGDAFPVTHEVLALMLGVRRPSVTPAARALREQGLVEYRRGTLRILDREGLERASCGCYWTIRREFDRLGFRPWPAAGERTERSGRNGS